MFTAQVLLFEERFRGLEPMSNQVNKERVNDTAKLIMHRLIARELGRDPSLVERAKDSLSRTSEHYEGYSFVLEWSELLEMSVPEVRLRLTSRDEDMTRLRLSSPFVLVVDLKDEALRRRIWKAAKRIAAIHPED
jgi:hypothetical protein